MRTDSINSPNNVIRNYAVNSKYKSNSVKNTHFCGNIAGDKTVFLLNDVLQKLSYYTKSEYKNLSKEEIQKLRQEYEYLIKDNKIYYERLEQMHQMASQRIEECCDNKYGKGKYHVITIGRSLSSIGKVLGYRIGEENVTNIPLSDANQYLDKTQMKYMSIYTNNIENFSKFLKTLGLSKNKIKSSGKKYIIMDYCATGASLEGATTLLTRADILGNKNIQSMSVIDCIQDISEANRLNSVLICCGLKHFSFVDKAYSLDSVPSAVKNPNTRADLLCKLFWFKLLDNEMNREIISQKYTKEQKQPVIKTVIHKISDFFINNIQLR